MPSQRTVIWAGAAAALVVAGAGAGALVWTYPDVVWPVPGSTQVEARVPEPTTLPDPVARPAAESPAPPTAQTAGPPAAETAALAPGAEAPAGNAAAPSGVKPAFDVVSVEPTGEAVIAGRAAPHAKVELRDGDKTLAEATADASGQFVIIPPTLTPGGHSLSLASEGKTEPETSNVVAVSVPAPEAPKAAAALSKTLPTAPSPPAAAMRTLATSPAAEGSRVTIQSVEGDGQGGLVTRGSAEPNSLVRLYLNGADIADAKTKSDGRWSLTIKHGVGPGAYSVRAEEVNPGSATVVASAEIRFDYPPGASGGAPPPSSSAPTAAPASEAQSSGSSPADVVMDSIQTAQVVSGHTLWALSQNYYGDPTRYPVIYEANKAQIRNPNLIYPGQVFVVPKFETKP
jgi:nucleoid-associated protein YgaU